jgi:nitrile hydratase accessory protein
LSGRDPSADAERLAALKELPRDDGEPIFKEPWEAQAFALAVQLSQKGYFTWKEWAAALAAEVKAAADRGEPDDGSHYYHHWLTALERLVAEKRLASRPLAGSRGGFDRRLFALQPSFGALALSRCPDNRIVHPERLRLHPFCNQRGLRT